MILLSGPKNFKSLIYFVHFLFLFLALPWGVTVFLRNCLDSGPPQAGKKDQHPRVKHSEDVEHCENSEELEFVAHYVFIPFLPEGRIWQSHARPILKLSIRNQPNKEPLFDNQGPPLDGPEGRERLPSLGQRSNLR